MADAGPEQSALLRLRADAFPGQQRRRQRRGDAQRRRAAHEFAPVDAAFLDLLGPVLKFVHLCLPGSAVMPRLYLFHERHTAMGAVASLVRRHAAVRRHVCHIIAASNAFRSDATRCRTDAPISQCRLTWRLGAVPDNAVGSVIRRVLYLVFLWPGPFRVAAAVPVGRSVPMAPPAVNWNKSSHSIKISLCVPDCSDCRPPTASWRSRP